MVLDYRAMALIADRIGRRGDAAAFRDRASALAAAINAHLWDEADGTYYTYDSVEQTLVRRDTYSNQVALWAHLASPDRASRMIERHLLNPEKLWSAHGIRSLAVDDAQYNNANVLKPYSNWQGPIWPHANWMAMHALLHYGYQEAALDVAERVSRLCLQDLDANGMMRENYDADTGAPLAAPSFISWNLLVAQMIREARSGIFLPDPERSLWNG
jgi:alpha,alpha-trehalase